MGLYILKSFISRQVIEDYGVGKVVASGDPEFEKNDLVVGLLTWEEYSVHKEAYILRKLDPMGFPPSYHIGILGLSGAMAYAGFFKVCKPKRGEKVFVSTVSGSIGNLVGQYAKLFGCHVVGCSGSKEKVAFLKEKLGFHDAFNYKEESYLKATLKRYFPDGTDIYFDNVRGKMLEAAAANMNAFGRVAACGVTSEYIDTEKRAAPDMEIFQVIEDISHGLSSIPLAFIGLFGGNNTGKKIVKIADE